MAPRKLRVLGLHGYRTSGAILKKQLSKWGPAVHDLFEFTFIDAPTAARGKSDVERTYEGPYFEWMQFNHIFQSEYDFNSCLFFTLHYSFTEILGIVSNRMKPTFFSKSSSCIQIYWRTFGFSYLGGCAELAWSSDMQDYTEYYNYEESIAYVVDYMENHGPFDGLLGFSQGATLAGAITAVQKREMLIKGKSAAALPPIKLVIFIAGFKINHQSIEVYDDVIDCPTLHLLGEKDWLKIAGEKFVANWKDPVVIRHPQSHTVPRLDEAAVSTVTRFVESIQTEQTWMEM